MTVYDPAGVKIIDLPVTKEAIIKFALMGDYYIELSFNLAKQVTFPRGAHVWYRNRKFEIMSTVRPEFDGTTGGFKYTIQLQAQQNHMKRFVCFWIGGANPEAVFHNTTDLASFGALIVANMNKSLGVDNWKLGAVTIENPETAKLVSFNGDKCWDALNTIAETFEVEWWTEENSGNVTLNFGKLEFGTPETFKRGDVVKSIPAKKGDDSSYGTRFFVFGSTRNLTKDYGQAEQGGITNHVSEIRLRLPNGQKYIDAIPNLPEQDIVEQVVFFDDIYPKNTETVTSVEKKELTPDEGESYPIYTMVCNDTPFVPSDMIENETLGAHFTSGSLMGREFELSIKYKPATWKPEDGFDKKFEIIAQTENSGDSTLVIPNENLKPMPGDTFVLTGVKLPQQRIEEAEEKLLAAGTSYAAKHSSDTDVYDCDTNPVYCQNNDKNYEAGQAVLLVGPQFGETGRLSRIQGYQKKLYNEYIATYTVGDNTPYSRIGSVESDVKATLYSQRIGIVETAEPVYLITRYDSTTPTDSNAYSARRSKWEFANKQAPDAFEGQMTFKAGAQFGDFASGITGIGGRITKNGIAELESLTLRRFLDVPELRYNRVDITMGDNWSAVCTGVIAVADTQNQIITLKLEAGEIGSPRVGDICMGIFHSTTLAENAKEDFDDGRGNRRFSGFATCYFRVAEILDFGMGNYGRFRYELRPVSTSYPIQFHPTSSMTFVGYGSFTDANRRSSRYETKEYQRYLIDVDDWEYTSKNIAAQFGNLTNLSIGGVDMSGYSAYLNNIYMSGVIRQFTLNGDEVPTIVDRGIWKPGDTYNRNDDVYWYNARWRCMTDGTTSEPAENTDAWLLLEKALKGDKGEQGCIYRITEWTTGIEYHNDIDLTSTEIRYIDIVTFVSNNIQYRFQCRQTHTSSKLTSPNPNVAYSKFWIQLNDMAPVYTPLLIAKNAVITFLQGNSIQTVGEDGSVFASMTAGEYPFFSGASTALEAPYRVSKAGKLFSTDADIKGRITATSGEIGGFAISATALTSESDVAGYGKLLLSADALNFSSTIKNTKVCVGTDALPATAGSNICPMYVENISTFDPQISNIGIYLNVDGKSHDTAGIRGNHALTIARGDVCGLRPHLREASASTTLSTLDCTVFIASNATSSLTLTLPAIAEIGQVFKVYNPSKKTIHIRLSTGTEIIYSSYIQIEIIKRSTGNTTSSWAVFRTPSEA